MVARHRLVLGGCLLLLIGVGLLVLAAVSVTGVLGGVVGRCAGIPAVWGLSGIFLAGARGAFRLARRPPTTASVGQHPG